MKFLSALLLPALLLACTTADQPEPRQQPRVRPRAAAAAARDFDLLPPDNWWHDPLIVEPIGLTNDQLLSLDKLHDQSAEIVRLENDLPVVVRELRERVSADPFVGADLVAAGQRVRELRDSLFDRQVALLAAERAVLSARQWQTLQSQLVAQERPRDDRQYGGYGGRRGGRGGMGGRGRGPG